MKYRSTKRWGHDQGLSVAFRQWKAESHCHFIHGYSIGVKFTFEADELDYRNWVVDFGDLKDLKKKIVDLFDHKTVVAEDDPQLEWFMKASKLGILDLNVLPVVGCEAFAELIFHMTEDYLNEKSYSPRCRLVSIEVAEHDGNSALVVAE
jgi:6-pyruvoyltetrahydropterin/6-carboxytetrahydropterin synthase